MKHGILVLLIALICSNLGVAGNAANLEFIGFSRDGAYLAFEQFGTGDGSGFPYSEVSIVEVSRNRLLERSSQTIARDNASVFEASRAARGKLATAFKRYGIVSGNQGRFLGLSRRLEDRIEGYQGADFVAFGRTYTLEVRSPDVGTMPDLCVQMPQLLNLTLSVARQSRVLQRDARLPATRQCAHGYEMRSAHLLERSLAVFVSYKTLGFEGPDARWLVVTTRL
jgi:predicted secreted protein